ncbi:MAG: FkbM family methyltransferase, partial [Candidatus Aminicenantales bacterium]
NGLNNVRSFPVALGCESTAGFLDRFQVHHEQPSGGSAQSIRIIPGDRLLEEAGCPQPNVAKIDVEGQEVNVLKGLKKTLSSATCRMICCEVHPPLQPDGVRAEDVRELLINYGFTRMKTHERPENFHIIAIKSDSGDSIE